MSIRGLKKMALLLTFWVALHGRCLKAQTITGDTVTNNLRVTGSNIYMGTQTSTTNPGWGTIYTDGTNSAVEIEATRNGNTWEWEEHNGAIMQMMLDTTNTLTLYNSSGTNEIEITLSPTGTSSFASSVIISGTDNEMPNQTLVNDNSVLTESLANTLYVSSSNSAITIGSQNYFDSAGISGGTNVTSQSLSLIGGNATAPYSFAEGASATASGYYSTAIGTYSYAIGRSSIALGVASTASGNYSTAMGLSSAAGGNGSVAMGKYSNASGTNSTTSGYYTKASGVNATASGYFTTASGGNATAMGQGTIAQALDDVAIGAGNIGGGSSNSWAGGDPLFEVGNGTNVTEFSSGSGYNNGYLTPGQGYVVSYDYNGGVFTALNTSYPITLPVYNHSDAFVVYKNGNAAVQENLSTGGTITASGSIAAGSISTSGTITATSLTTSSNITAHAYITTTQTGDIPMYLGN